MISRRLQQEAHRLADQQSDRLRETLPSKFFATVSTVSAGQASDGNALVAVTRLGQEVTVAGYYSSYTPVVGHRVVCHVIDDQIVVANRVVGHP